MQSGNLWQVLGLCLLLVGAWAQAGPPRRKENDAEQKPYEISISGNTVELTCPTESENQIKWKKNGKEIHGQFGKQLLLVDFSEMDDSGYYQCFVTEGNTEEAHLLYLKARVCENCMEVNLMAVATIIVVDICVTLGLLLLVYYWSKSRKAKATPMTRGAGAGSRPRGQNRERPPPVPNPDYEPIRKGQRDLYAGLNQRGV